jgi:glycine dehydrogenase
VAVRSHLAPFLPGDPLAGLPRLGTHGRPGVGGAVRLGRHPADPVGVLALMGADGLTRATTRSAIARRQLHRGPPRSDAYPVLYRGAAGTGRPRVHHRPAAASRKATGVTVDDVAKRLIDYGFHAPR